MTAISSTAILDGAWQIVYDLLTNTGYGITDTAASPRTRSNFIFSAFPEKGKNKANWPGYPLVIIHPPSISGGNLTLHKQKRNIEVSIQIDVYDKSAKNCKTMADDVINILNTRQTAIRKDYLGNFRIGSSDSITDYLDGQRIHRITIISQWDYHRT